MSLHDLAPQVVKGCCRAMDEAGGGNIPWRHRKIGGRARRQTLPRPRHPAAGPPLINPRGHAPRAAYAR
ncbi:hypothetical protein L538_0722 [Bordetella hinzii 4161]|nr:hypothetical protein L538_0722 [Bordetella hinzii 4161]